MNPDYIPREGVNGFTLKGSPTSLVDAALQVYARTGMYPESRPLHEAAMAYRAELIRIVTVEHYVSAREIAGISLSRRNPSAMRPTES